MIKQQQSHHFNSKNPKDCLDFSMSDFIKNMGEGCPLFSFKKTPFLPS